MGKKNISSLSFRKIDTFVFLVTRANFLDLDVSSFSNILKDAVLLKLFRVYLLRVPVPLPRDSMAIPAWQRSSKSRDLMLVMVVLDTLLNKKMASFSKRNQSKFRIENLNQNKCLTRWAKHGRNGGASAG